MEIKVEQISGGQATEIVAASGLAGYGHRDRIEQYKQWMLDGKWALLYNGTGSKFINDPLIFLPNGMLYEGKHRVIALSELPPEFVAPFWVLRNFTEIETFRKWLSDLTAGLLPKSNLPTRPLPAHPRASLGNTANVTADSSQSQ